MLKRELIPGVIQYTFDPLPVNHINMSMIKI